MEPFNSGWPFSNYSCVPAVPLFRGTLWLIRQREIWENFMEYSTSLYFTIDFGQDFVIFWTGFLGTFGKLLYSNLPVGHGLEMAS